MSNTISIITIWNQNVQDTIVGGIILTVIIYFLSRVFKFFFPKPTNRIWNWIKKRFYKSYFYEFKNTDTPLYDDFWQEKCFKLRNFIYEIEITPVNSYYWRFGFRLSKNRIFPAINNERHINTAYPDIHIGVGNRLPTLLYNKTEPITLITYHLGDDNIQPIYYEDYKSNSVVIIKISFNNKNNKTEITYSYNHSPIKNKPVNIKQFKYFKFFAWADGLPFYLKVKIKKYYFRVTL